MFADQLRYQKQNGYWLARLPVTVPVKYVIVGAGNSRKNARRDWMRQYNRIASRS